MTTVDKDNFEKKLHDWLKDLISCHGKIDCYWRNRVLDTRWKWVWPTHDREIIIVMATATRSKNSNVELG